MKKFWEEFKTFALKGNVMSMAIGVLIGGAFNALVTAFTSDFVKPILNIFGDSEEKLGWVIPLPGGSEGIQLGDFVSSLLNFFITALILFLMVKAMNKLLDSSKKPEEPAAPAEPTEKTCPYCKTSIPILASRCPHCTSLLEENR